ncbi:MAG: YiiX/YebB-like N1pC/P60 family cysteine hydrolase [Reichenbachiella sp.]|uniref:YiiX/YebB-like N1pC/P60 family cysteine hydrolase n=1 Tax=Reichenbachiella sp. TaxID=2184521 RepID=UPI003266C583
MYCFEIDQLQPGDILLTRSDSRVSELVRKVTGSQYSHAILYLGISSIIESDGLGVQSNNLQRILITNNDDAKVLRLKSDSRSSIIQNVEIYARRLVGTAYSTDEAKISHLNTQSSAKEPNRQFCSRFVAQSYSDAGINLVDNPDYCTPEHLLQSDQLLSVENCLRVASLKEIEFANSENPMDRQTKIHNEIFAKARTLTSKDVQTFEQLNESIIEFPEIDIEITEFVRKSGFLDMMEEDEKKNPQHYNAEKLVEYYKDPDQILEVALRFASIEPKTRERLEMTIFHLIQLNRIYPREYFKMEIELYQKLIKYSHKRETEAIKALKHC